MVCEDKLGIGAELEAEMQRVVDTYACEWKNAVKDPATRKRFRHFVNSEEADRNVVFVEERGQIRPATRRGTRDRRARQGRRRWPRDRRTLARGLRARRPGRGRRRVRAGRWPADRAVPGRHGRVYALDNFDPASRANVLARGLIGNLQGERVVASPIYKNHLC